MASSNIDWICGQCTHKNEGSSEPGPCHFCQTPHPKRKAVVVSVPTSVSPAKSVCIRQPARSSGSAIDLSAPDAAQAVAFASPTKPVCIGQPARYSGSVIDLSDPDLAQAVASASSLAKAVSICQPAPCSTVPSLTCPLQMRRWLWHPRCWQSLCSFASQHCATPVLSLICPLQMGRWLWHPRRRQSLCLGYPPVL